MTEPNLNDYLGSGNNPFFKANQMEKESIKVVVEAVREADLPNSGKTLILDFTYKREKKSLALNKTNIKALIEKYGLTVSEWIGKTITLYKVRVTNPKTKQEVDSIRIK